MGSETKGVILTGVREIDAKLGGGIPAGSLGLIEGQADAGKSVLCQHLAYGALAGNCSVAYYTTENNVKSLISQMDSLALNTLDHFLTDRLRIYPLYFSSYIKDTETPLLILDDHFSTLPSQFKLIIVDSVTLLMAHSSSMATVDFFWTCKKLCSEGRSVLLVVHSYAFEKETLSRSSSMCDVHLKLKLEQVGDRMIKAMEVLKVRGAQRPTGDVVSFEIEPKIGMRVIPFARAKV
ncbi:MAG: ATPase domain-containing protein [Dehalococcoidales bacterium]|jgi:flagellar protein FlaH